MKKGLSHVLMKEKGRIKVDLGNVLCVKELHVNQQSQGPMDAGVLWESDKDFAFLEK